MTTLAEQPPQILAMIYMQLRRAYNSKESAAISIATPVQMQHLAAQLSMDTEDYLAYLRLMGSTSRQLLLVLEQHLSAILGFGSGQFTVPGSSLQKRYSLMWRTGVAAIALCLTDPADVRRVVMKCPLLRPDVSLIHNCAWFPNGLLGRLTRTWSMTDAVTAFIECRLAEPDSAGVASDFRQALEVKDETVLYYAWGSPTQYLLGKCPSTADQMSVIEQLCEHLQLTQQIGSLLLARALFVLAGGPNLRGLLDYCDSPQYIWCWDPLSPLPEWEVEGDTLYRYSSKVLAAATNHMAAIVGHQESVLLVHSLVSNWSKLEQFFFLADMTALWTPAATSQFLKVYEPLQALFTDGAPFQDLKKLVWDMFDFMFPKKGLPESEYCWSPVERQSTTDMLDIKAESCFHLLARAIGETDLNAMIEEIRASKKYQDMFTVTNSVEDYSDYPVRVGKIASWLASGEAPKRKFRAKVVRPKPFITLIDEQCNHEEDLPLTKVKTVLSVVAALRSLLSVSQSRCAARMLWELADELS